MVMQTLDHIFKPVLSFIASGVSLFISFESAVQMVQLTAAIVAICAALVTIRLSLLKIKALKRK